jgi:hypothetical protein
MGKISTCQTKLIALLAADAFFTDNTDPDNPVIKVPIVDKQQGDIESLLDEKLAELGVGLIVILRRARLVDSEDLFGLGLNCQFALSAVYNPTVADAGASTAYDIVERAAQLLQGKPNGVNAGDKTLTSRFSVDPAAIAPLPAAPKKAFLDIQLLLINTTIDLSA